MKDIGGNIRHVRTDRKMKQEDLARQLHVSRQTVSSWETGNSRPDIEMLEKIADVLNVPLNTLLYGENRMNKKNIRNKVILFICCLLVIMFLYILRMNLFSALFVQAHYTGAMLFENLYARVLLPYVLGLTAYLMSDLLMDVLHFSPKHDKLTKGILIFFIVMTVLWTVYGIYMTIAVVQMIHHPESLSTRVLIIDNTFMKYSTPFSLVTGAGICACLHREDVQDLKISYIPEMLAVVLIIFLVCGGIISYRLVNPAVSDEFRHETNDVIENNVTVRDEDSGQDVIRLRKI